MTSNHSTSIPRTIDELCTQVTSGQVPTHWHADLAEFAVALEGRIRHHGYEPALAFVWQEMSNAAGSLLWNPGLYVGGQYHRCRHCFRTRDAARAWYEAFLEQLHVCTAAFGGYVVELSDFDSTWPCQA